MTGRSRTVREGASRCLSAPSARKRVPVAIQTFHVWLPSFGRCRGLCKSPTVRKGKNGVRQLRESKNEPFLTVGLLQ